MDFFFQNVLFQCNPCSNYDPYDNYNPSYGHDCACHPVQVAEYAVTKGHGIAVCTRPNCNSCQARTLNLEGRSSSSPIIGRNFSLGRKRIEKAEMIIEKRKAKQNKHKNKQTDNQKEEKWGMGPTMAPGVLESSFRNVFFQ